MKTNTMILSGIMAFAVLTGFAILAAADEFAEEDLSGQEMVEEMEGDDISDGEILEVEEETPEEESPEKKRPCPKHPRFRPRHINLSAMKERFENRTFDREDVNLTRLKERFENRTFDREKVNLTELKERMENRSFERGGNFSERDGEEGPQHRRRMGRMHHFRGCRGAESEREN